MRDQIILDAALDGCDWQTAAQCILANPTSTRFTEALVRPLAQIALDVDLQATVANKGRFVCGIARLVDDMEAFDARKN